MATRDGEVTAQNWVLAALGDDDRQRLLRHGDRVSLTRDQTLREAGEASSALYFPTGAVVSLVQSTTTGDINEVASIGRDGMVGVPFFLGDGIAPWDARCQIAGEAMRVPAEVVGNVSSATLGVRNVLGRYSQALLIQIAHNSACNQLHSMLQRCSRWILLVRRQSGRDEFPLTQQALATMLAVRRATITVTAGELQKAGAISYHHGKMRVTDAAVLEDNACKCYSAITQTYDRLFHGGS